MLKFKNLNLKVMRKKDLLLMIVIFLAMGIGKAQNSDFKTKILKTCITMPEFQDSYAVSDDNTGKKVYVLQHGISFTQEDINDIEGYQVVLMTKAELAGSNIANYFLFWTIDVINEKSVVEFTYEGASVSKKVRLNIKEKDQVMLISDKQMEEVSHE
jgi:hypothetical protein